MLTTIATLFWEAKDVSGLLDVIPALIKKRGQLKRPVTELVNLCMEWMRSDALDRPSKYRMIAVLAEVTEGKIFVETERARIKRYEAQLKEQEGKVDEACLILQEEQVEIIGAMEPREKTDYILDQMRLVLLRNDYIRLPIVAKKINPKILNADKDLSDLKLRYYEFLLVHYLHEEDYREASACYRNILDTPNLPADRALQALVGTALFLLLAPLSDSQLSEIKGLLEKEKRRFDDIPEIRDLAKAFLGNALIRGVDQAVRNVELAFAESQLHADRGIATGASRFALLQKRIVQFNLIKVLSVFYSRMRLAKLAQIVGLTVDQAEVEITELVANKSLQVKIDRPAGIVCFHPRMSPQARLDEWGGNINKALDLVESTSNLIQKEIQLHAAKEKIRLAKA
jgi:26S proteasome regulatory subunit N5